MGGALARHTVANGLRLAARSARAARALAASRMQAWSAGSRRRRASLAAFVTTPAPGAAGERGQITVRAYGLMLPPGLFQPSHSSTRSSAGCLAMYPPAQGLNARDGVGARGLGWRLIVPGLGAGTVVRFEVVGRSR